MDLKGTLALVTGGSSGIGRAIAEALLAERADVAICGRDEKNVLRAAEEMRNKYNGNCLGIPCDVRNREEVSSMLELATEAGTCTLDLLVNNAGVSRFAPIRKLDAGMWDEVLETNLTGPFNSISAALPHMKAGSFIFNIGSLSAVSSYPGGAAYNASKAGLLAFSEAIMLDLRKEDIRVCCILSGSVNTRMEGPDGRAREPWKMEAEDIARVVLDLVKYPPRVLPSRIDVRPTRTS